VEYNWAMVVVRRQRSGGEIDQKTYIISP
jgi:hypothetical protein